MTVIRRFHQTDEPETQERRPLAVLVAIGSLIGAEIWLIRLAPDVRYPTFSVHPPRTWPDILFWAAILVGTLLGVRIAWDLLCFFSILSGVFVLLAAIDDPQAQTIGGAVLLILGVVLLFLPSVRSYATKHVRLVIE